MLQVLQDGTIITILQEVSGGEVLRSRCWDVKV